ncbi:MAG: signal peptidase II [Burkholderiaceae bacterium]|nr:signal peptidase II [Burkholderiaceae bacterium]
MNNIARNQSQKITAFLIAAALALLASQTSSYLVNASLAIGETRVVNSLLHITHVRNMGGTFGAFPGHSVLFALISALILVLCTALFFKQRATTWIQFVFFGLIVGGGASNVVDRVVLGSVVDFINLQGIPHWHYVFNTADVFIDLGIWPSLLIGVFLSRKENP